MDKINGGEKLKRSPRKSINSVSRQSKLEDEMDREVIEKEIENEHGINRDIAKILEEISVYYDSEPFRARSFLNASKTIMAQKKPISSGKEALELKGIGKSIAEVIQEYLDTGKVSRLEELKRDNFERNEVLAIFRNIYGVGSANALKFYKEGYRTVEELSENPDLNHGQKEGIKYYYDLLKKIDRKDIDFFKKKITPLFKNEKMEIVGSYRRKEKQSGDIDILFDNSTGITIEEIKEKLRDFVVADLASGKTKFMAIMKIKTNLHACRLDIRLVNPKEWTTAILYFTGSQDFNIYCRNKAIEKGLLLNEYGLYKNGKRIELDSEEAVMKYLEIPYFKPEERVRNFLSLHD